MVATYKDLKLGYDKVRLNIWCEEIRFSIMTPNTFLDFDDLKISFTSRANKNINMDSKIKSVRLDEVSLSLPISKGMIRLTQGQSLNVTCIMRAQP